MFVRFRRAGHRLQISIVETHHLAGAVKHEHIASWGSIAEPQSIAARVAFWQRAHQRLSSLSNRIAVGEQAKLLAALHARVPMVTPDE